MTAPAAPDAARWRRADTWCAAALAVLTTVLVGATAQQLGFTRDEGYYFKAGETIWGWLADLAGDPAHALSAAGIEQGWRYNAEHPPLMKLGFAIGYGARELLSVEAHDALRAFAWLVAGLSVALTFALARALLPRGPALFAALLWLSLPHPFWHMHVACFDVGITAAHTALVLAWLRWRRTARGALAVGVVFGVAMAVKHNVLAVPALLALHWLAYDARSWWQRQRPLAVARGTVTLPPVPLSFLSLAVVGPLVLFCLWPWLWPDPFVRWGNYIGYHLRHEHYPILYFGELLTHPPFPVHFPFVMSAVTLPLAAMVLMALGALLAAAAVLRHARARGREPELSVVPLGDVAREPSASPAALLLLNAAYPFFLIALPSSPVFGGTKHWMNALPFLCVLAAWAMAEIAARLALSRVVVAALAVAVLLPGAWISARAWPYGLGSYNELIGFARGAANVGMQRTFWGYEPRAALAEINARTPPRGRIHFGDTNADSHRMYRRDGLLRDDIAFSNTVRGAAVASVQPQGEFKQQWMDVCNEWDRTPEIVLHADGVPVATISFKPPPP